MHVFEWCSFCHWNSSAQSQLYVSAGSWSGPTSRHTMKDRLGISVLTWATTSKLFFFFFSSNKKTAARILKLKFVLLYSRRQNMAFYWLLLHSHVLWIEAKTEHIPTCTLIKACPALRTQSQFKTIFQWFSSGLGTFYSCVSSEFSYARNFKAIKVKTVTLDLTLRKLKNGYPRSSLQKVS